MTKKEFLKFEQVCKKAWGELAKTGSADKQSYLHKYSNYCPACEVSKLTSKKNCLDMDCQLCPIDLWRGEAIRTNAHEVSAVVCQREKNLYYKWMNSYNEEDRSNVARKISRLKWTFLPEYKKLKDKEDKN